MFTPKPTDLAREVLDWLDQHPDFDARVEVALSLPGDDFQPVAVRVHMPVGTPRDACQVLPFTDWQLQAWGYYPVPVPAWTHLKGDPRCDVMHGTAWGVPVTVFHTPVEQSARDAA